jgi:hypothetical protein
MHEGTAIFIPSLNRPASIEKMIDNIRKVTDRPYRMYFMVSDDESEAVLKAHSGEDLEYFRDSGDTRYVTRMNKLYRLTEEPTFFCGSDDVVHYPRWLSVALGEMEEHHVDLVVMNDLGNPHGTQALVRRSYADSGLAVFDYPNTLFYPHYHHNGADVEMFYTAERQGKLFRSKRAIVEHFHPAWGKSEIDQTYLDFAMNEDKHVRDNLVWSTRRPLIDLKHGTERSTFLYG